MNWKALLLFCVIYLCGQKQAAHYHADEMTALQALGNEDTV